MRRLLLLPVLALVGVMFVASPANAATVTSFTANGTAGEVAVEPDSTVQLAWSITPGPEELVDVSLSSDRPDLLPEFDGPREGSFEDGTLTGGESITLSAPGRYVFTITADGANSDADTATLVVTVAAPTPDPTIIPVPPVAFPDPCTAVLPADPNVNYGVNYGGFGNALPAGPVDLPELLENGIPLAIVAVPNDGFAFPEGADASFEIDLEDCLGTIVESGLVEARAICKGVTFTNVADEALFVAYGDLGSRIDEDEFELAVGESRTVDTDDDLVFYVAVTDSEETFVQFDEVEVEQDCTRAAAAHPTVAPAAGSDGASTAGLGALAALTLAGGAALGARRLRRTA